MEDTYFPVLILVRDGNDTKMKVVEAKGLPVDMPFEILATHATDEMKDLAIKMFNKGWTEGVESTLSED